jgi:hypothetical protein
MKTAQKLSLLTLALLVASCNEKVSPELQSSSATTPDATVAVPPEEYYFRVVNSSDALLNYKLHKTGADNLATNCEIKNTTGLSNEIFRGNLSANDITCYFEAEELSLLHAGMNFKVENSANTCDFVGYSPFAFYDQIPGNSSGTFTQVDCTNDTTDGSHVVTAAAARGLSIATNGTNLDCGDWATTNIVPATRVKFTPTSDEELCRFNYPGTGNNCDVGTIVVNVLSVTYTPAGDDPVTQPEVLKHEIISRRISCGGSVGNCVKGPIEEVPTYEAGAVKITEILQPEINKTFSTEYKLPKLIGTYGSTKRYANYRRDLASTQIDYGTADPSDLAYTSFYKNAFSSAAFGKTFNPNVMDFYSSNKKMDGTTSIIGAPELAAASYPSNMYKAVPLAADPFLGLAARINPFYTFYCFDTAFDIKARVRMVVRDWDRVFPTNADIEYVSDIHRGVNARQDNPEEIEVPGEMDEYIYFNDLGDWDDKVPMIRTLGPYVSTSTEWEPVSGFFDPANFTNSAY